MMCRFVALKSIICCHCDDHFDDGNKHHKNNHNDTGEKADDQNHLFFCVYRINRIDVR